MNKKGQSTILIVLLSILIALGAAFVIYSNFYGAYSEVDYTVHKGGVLPPSVEITNVETEHGFFLPPLREQNVKINGKVRTFSLKVTEEPSVWDKLFKNPKDYTVTVDMVQKATNIGFWEGDKGYTVSVSMGQNPSGKYVIYCELWNNGKIDDTDYKVIEF
jgi:hypothetical protein